jgi:hypothetical protein
MLKKLTFALFLGLALPLFAAAVYAGCGCGGGAASSAATASAGSASVAQAPRRVYRSYSYLPGYGSYRGYRGGFNSGVRGATSKVLGR